LVQDSAPLTPWRLDEDLPERLGTMSV